MPRVLVAHVLQQGTVGDLEDAVGLLRHAAVVRDDEERGAQLLVDLAEEVVDRVGVHGVEVAGGLVGEHQRRAVHERAGDGHALLLTARELVGVLLLEALQAEQRQGLLGPRLRALDCGRASDERRHQHVLEHAELRQQVVELEHEADELVAQGGALLARRRRRVVAAEHDRPVVGVSSRPSRLSSVDLPDPDWPMIDANSPRVERERHLMQGHRLHDAPVDLAEVLGADERLSHSGSPRSGRAWRCGATG